MELRKVSKYLRANPWAQNYERVFVSKKFFLYKSESYKKRLTKEPFVGTALIFESLEKKFFFTTST